MSMAVEHSLPPREVEVDLPRSESHAAELFNMAAAPNPAAGRETSFAAATQPSRSSYDSMQQRQYQDAMDDMEVKTPTSDHQVAEEQAPVLPQKSALRASRMLDSLAALKISTPVSAPAFTQTPHDEYLSSEEEASSTTDDYSDFEYDSSSDDLSPCPTDDGHKHQVTARVVSVVFSGKPSVIEVPQNRRSISPNSIERPQHTTTQLQQEPPVDTETRTRRRMSSSTISSRPSSRSIPRATHPPRSSSMQPPGASRPNLPFLQIDPYANGSTYSLGATQSEPTGEEPQEPREFKPVEDDRPKTPKSPAAMFRGVARAMSLMKRRSSNRLIQAYLAPEELSARSNSPSAASIPEEAVEEMAEEPRNSPMSKTETRAEAPTAAATPPPPTRPPPRPLLRPVTQDDAPRPADNNARMGKPLSVARTFHGEQMLESPISPMTPVTPLTTVSPVTPNKRSSAFGFARRRMSVKLPGKHQF